MKGRPRRLMWILLAVILGTTLYLASLPYNTGPLIFALPAAILGVAAGLYGGDKLRDYLRKRSRFYRRYILRERE